MVWLFLFAWTTPALASDDTGDAGIGAHDTGESDCEDGAAPQTWYHDDDADGWGEPGTATVTCDTPDDGAPRAGDCDDDDPARFPGAAERCDGIDTDCDGRADPSTCTDAVALTPGSIQGCDCRGTGGTFGLAAVGVPWWRRRRVTAA